VALDEAALRAAVEWSIRYLPDFRLPDKALDLVDQACAAARFQTLTPQVEKKNCGLRSDTCQVSRAEVRKRSKVCRETLLAARRRKHGLPRDASATLEERTLPERWRRVAAFPWAR